ncbi:MAG TPA: DegQ family serine endoprotease [Burkholderiales bacterium]|nr:DegQ family serine endoprotease [Burkholderiales bacterium]
MKLSCKIRATGAAAGLALFVALGSFPTLAAAGSSSAQAVPPGPIPESVIAPAVQLGKAFAAVAAHVKPAVVSVYSEKMVNVQSQDFPFGDDFLRRFFGDQLPQPKQRGEQKEHKVPQQGMGSGMILDKQGHILTNYHVVSDVDEIKVQLADKRSFPAEIVGTDPKTDVAIIKIKGPVPDNLPTVQLGDSDAMQDGNLVMAVGAPFGLTQTVTIGIISAKGRSDVGIADYEDFLQTDAPINPGNSGGPLVNMHGEVIGMNSAIATGGGGLGGEGQSAGVGFAIPTNMIKAMLPTLIKGKPITRGMLGVVIQDVTEDLAKQFHLADATGALISQVNKGSPADKAGLKAGDVIVRFDGKEVQDNRQLRNLVAATAPGVKARVGVVRNGKEETFIVTIGKMPTEAVAAAKQPAPTTDQFAKFGLSVQALTPDLAKQLGLEGERGALVSDVDEGGPASLAGLQSGDLITEANHQPIADVAELRRVLDTAKDSVLLLVKRRGQSLFVVLRVN